MAGWRIGFPLSVAAAGMLAVSAVACTKDECEKPADCPAQYECTQFGECRKRDGPDYTVPPGTPPSSCMPDPNVTDASGKVCDDSTDCRNCRVCVSKVCVGRGSLRFSLTWEVPSDFDLHVMTPAGDHLYQTIPMGGGGSLDVSDCMFDQCTSPTPVHVENIFFDAHNPGTYETWAVNFSGTVSGTFKIEVASTLGTIQTFSDTLPATQGGESQRYSVAFQ